MSAKNKPSNPSDASAGGKSWGARLDGQADQATAELLASLDVDRELWRYDIAGSIIHAQMLSEAGLILKKEFAEIKRGLIDISADIEADKLPMPVELEDIHMVIEKALIDRIGETGKKLHTGRSRNDQVALDLRLWARDAVKDISDLITAMQSALLDMARRHGRFVMPAYTHLQRAQPIMAGHALLAYVEMLQRDKGRLASACTRINVCPLGSGAVAGTSLPLDRCRTAELLGFADISGNSIDATSDRDFLAELCFCCAAVGVHLSRWAEDWIIYSSNEFNMIQLDDAYCTSSSMMPQKKNADTLELIRGKSASAIADLVGLLTLLKGLPLAYNRDLQDDKRFAFRAAATCKQVLTVAAGIVETTRFKPQAIADGLDEGYLDATALAEYLVTKGVPFRQAHQVVGKLVVQAEANDMSLPEVTLETFQAACEAIQADVYEHLGAENVVKRYAPIGAGGEEQLNQQIDYWDKVLSSD